MQRYPAIRPVPPWPVRWGTRVLVLAVVLWSAAAFAQQRTPISAFVGDYAGEAVMIAADGTAQRRDLSVSIRETKKGFSVRWTTVTYSASGQAKEKSYEIEFLPTDRDGIFSAAMRRNLFGHAVPLDPMKGEPFVWGRISGSTLTVFSLFIADDGGYELQQYDRTLTDGGLTLEFRRLRNGEKMRSVTAFLERR